MGANSIVVFGDILLDQVSDLTSVEHQQIPNILQSGNLNTPIITAIGGGDLQFAVAARQVGFEKVTLIGKVGGERSADGQSIPDAPAQMAIDYLNKNHVQSMLVFDHELQTGKTIILYFPNNERLMVSDPLAAASFTKQDITPEMQAELHRADLFHISGYSLLQDDRRAAALDMLRIARTGAGKVALDIVPHSIYRSFSLQELKSLLGNMVDWAFLQITTAHQLAGLGRLANRQVSEETIEKILEALTPVFPSFTLEITADHLMVFDQGERIEYIPDSPQPRDASRRGYTAQTHAELLYQRLNKQTKQI